MDLYNFLTTIQSRLGVPITQAEKESMVGTLRVAGYDDLSNPADVESAIRVVTRLFQRKEAALVESASKKASAFGAIKDLNAKGLCGKCKGKMSTVKLANSEEANYCPTCRVTLWK